MRRCFDRLPLCAHSALKLTSTRPTYLLAGLFLIDHLSLSHYSFLSFNLQIASFIDISKATFGVRDYRRSNKFKETSKATKSTLVDDLVAKIPNADADLNTDAIMEALKSMKPIPLPEEFLCHREFIDFCQRVEHSANQLTADEAVDILCMMHVLGVPFDAKIRQRLLRVMQVNIADLHVERALRLGNLLETSRPGETILSAAIRIVLPILLLKKLPEKLSDHGLTIELLKFIARRDAVQPQPHQELMEYVMNAVLNANMSAHQAANIFHALLQFHSNSLDSELYDKATLHVTDILAQNMQALTSTRLQVLLKLYAGLCSRRQQVLNERFFDAFANDALKLEPEFDLLIHHLYFFQKAVSAIH